MQQAMQIGVCGFLSKSSDDISILPTVITRVLQGEKYIDPLTSKALVKHMMSNHLSSPTWLCFLNRVSEQNSHPCSNIKLHTGFQAYLAQ